jgi:hypothetical protein
MRRLSTLFLVIAAAAVPVSACTGAQQASKPVRAADAPTTDAGPINAPTRPADQDISQLDPCTILPVSEIEQVIGKLDERPRTGRTGTDESSCVFTGARPDPDTQVMTRHSIVIMIARRSAYELEKAFQLHQPLNGLGDDAFTTEQTNPDNSAGYGVWAAKGGRALGVTGSKEQQQGVLALARSLLGRL